MMVDWLLTYALGSGMETVNHAKAKRVAPATKPKPARNTPARINFVLIMWLDYWGNTATSAKQSLRLQVFEFCEALYARDHLPVSR